MKPVVIFIDGQELVGWTEMTLSRSKDKMTGELTLSLFMGHIPSAPVAVDCCRGKEITVYIGGHMAFVGGIDKRKGTGAKHGDEGTTASEPSSDDSGGGGSYSISIGPNEY